MKIPFVKMQGLGNDFIVIDSIQGPARELREISAKQARKICDRRFGVGADQILWLRKPHDAGAQVRMEILNNDGSVAEMCGNGIRAVAVYLRDSGAVKSGELGVETLAGLKKVWIKGSLVRVDMGPPKLGASRELLGLRASKIEFHEVSMGNPHAVVFVDELTNYPVEALGSEAEVHPRFPQRTNVEFVQVTGTHAIRVVVWERGAGLTLACGTGACASAVAAIATGRVQSPVQVALPGGALSIDWAGGQFPVMMEGPAEEVFRGEIEL